MTAQAGFGILAGIPCPPAGYRIAAPGRFSSWARLTDVPVPDWGSYFDRASTERLQSIGVWLAGDPSSPCTLEDMAMEEEECLQPSGRCLFTVLRRQKGGGVTWYTVRRLDPLLRLCHVATIKRLVVEDWAPAPFVQSSRNFTIQLPGDSCPQDVLSAAIHRGFEP